MWPFLSNYFDHLLLGCIARTTHVYAIYCYRPSSVVDRSVTVVSPAKTAEPIEMPFGLKTPVGPRNHVLDGGPDPHGKRQFWGERGVPLYSILCCHLCKNGWTDRDVVWVIDFFKPKLTCGRTPFHGVRSHNIRMWNVGFDVDRLHRPQQYAYQTSVKTPNHHNHNHRSRIRYLSKKIREF